MRNASTPGAKGRFKRPHQLQVLHGSAAGAFAQVSRRPRHGLAVLLVGEHAQLQLVGVGQRVGGQLQVIGGGSTLTHCSGVLVRR